MKICFSRSGPFKFETFIPKQPQTGVGNGGVVKDTAVLLDFIQSSLNAQASAIGPV